MNEADFARMMAERDFGEGTSSRSVNYLRLNISTYCGYPTGIGGLIRDSSGKWVKGFMGHTRATYFSLEAELQALYYGLVLLDDMDAKGAEICFQTESAMEALMSPNESDFVVGNLFTKCWELWTITESTLTYDFYESFVLAEPAHWLAKKGRTRSLEFEVLEVPPVEMQELFDI